MMAVGGLLILAGCLFPLLVLMDTGAAWTWDTKTLSDLEGAKINATPKGNTSEGVRLARQGARPVSLISPPLNLAPDVSHIAEVSVALPDAEAPTRQTVYFLWQVRALDADGTPTDAQAYKFDSTQAILGKDPAIVRFPVTVPPDSIHRIGFQFPEADGDVVIRRMAFPSLTMTERLAMAADQWAGREPFEPYSVNFLRGPSILGESAISVLALLIVVAAGFVLLMAGLRRRRLSIVAVIGIIVVVWAIEDARATRNLFENSREEVEQFSKLDQRVDRWARSHRSYEVAWAADLLVENTDPGMRYCVVTNSGDAFMIRHRLAYLVAPKLVETEDCASADLIVVIKSDGARYSPDDQILTLPDDTMIDARPVAQLADHCYILRRNAK